MIWCHFVTPYSFIKRYSSQAFFFWNDISMNGVFFICRKRFLYVVCVSGFSCRSSMNISGWWNQTPLVVTIQLWYRNEPIHCTIKFCYFWSKSRSSKFDVGMCLDKKEMENPRKVITIHIIYVFTRSRLARKLQFTRHYLITKCNDEIFSRIFFSYFYRNDDERSEWWFIIKLRCTHFLLSTYLMLLSLFFFSIFTHQCENLLVFLLEN
jgi:hypothetical protein